MISRTNVLFTASLLALVALATWGIAEASATLKKLAADGKNLRVSEVDSCAPTTAETPHFSGCSSIL